MYIYVFVYIYIYIIIFSPSHAVFVFFLPHRMQDDEGTQGPAGFGKESRSDHPQQVSC